MTNFEQKRREAFEISFRDQFRHKSNDWIERQLIPVNDHYTGEVASSHWHTWQAALDADQYNVKLKTLLDRCKGDIEHVRSLIIEGCDSGFNPLVGDWVENLFKSNGRTYATLREIEALCKVEQDGSLTTIKSKNYRDVVRMLEREVIALKNQRDELSEMLGELISEGVDDVYFHNDPDGLIEKCRSYIHKRENHE